MTEAPKTDGVPATGTLGVAGGTAAAAGGGSEAGL